MRLADGTIVPAMKVGLIIERGEIAEPEDEEGVMETFPARYEVWLLPDQLRDVLFDFFGRLYARGEVPTPEGLANALSAVPNVICRELKLDRVEFAEKILKMKEAWPIIQEFFQDSFGLRSRLADSDDEEDVEEEDEAAAPVPAAPQLPQSQPKAEPQASP